MRLDALADEQLLSRFLEGDERAFELLVRRHEDLVFSLTFRMTGDRSDALEASQEAFISAFRRAGSFRGEAAFSTWLYRIAANAAHDVMRRRKREYPSEEVPETPADDPAGLVALRIDVAAALARLPEEYRDAVVLHDLGGVAYDDVARITGAKLGTVKSRISRGRRMLAELLEPTRAREPSKETR
ncbi:MAG: sigma-70 family RNA polymerase sigma factor [Actinomycetota bacterium]